MRKVASSFSHANSNQRRAPRERRREAGCLLAAGILLAAAPCSARDFSAPVRISSGLHAASSPDVKAQESAVITVLAEDGDVVLRVGTRGEPAAVARDVPDLLAPRLALGSGGRVAIFFVASAAPGGAGAEGDTSGLWLSRGAAGDFEETVEVIGGLASPPGHAVAYGPQDAPALAWEDPASSSIVLRLEEAESTVAQGSSPDLAVDRFGFAHVVYLREGRAWYRSGRLEPDFSRELALAPEEDAVQGLALAVDNAGSAHVVLQTPGGLLHAAVTGEEVSPVEPVFAAGTMPRLAAAADGTLAVAFLVDGSVLVSVKPPGDGPFEDPVPASRPEIHGAVERHAIAADASSALYVALEADGEVYLTSDVPPPEPAFSVATFEVRAGGEVRFVDESSGRIEERLWDFGDGEVSTQARPSHRYLEEGRYRPSLRVSGPGGTRTLASDREILVLPPRSLFHFPPLRVREGDRDLVAPVLLTSEVPSKGFQVVLRGSPEIVLRGGTLDSTVSRGLAAEFVQVDLEEGAGAPVLVAAVLWDYDAPHDGRLLAAGENLPVLRVAFDLSDTARQGGTGRLQFLSNYGPQDKGSILVSKEGGTLEPLTRDGNVEIGAVDETAFLRGDANDDGGLDLSDAIFILGYLFLGAGEPDCLDAADTNDDGVIDISDPIGLLQFLFLSSGLSPPYPYPQPGLDGTLDSLGPCR